MAATNFHGDDFSDDRAFPDRMMDIAQRYVPEGYVVEYRKSLSGRHYGARKLIQAPKPVTRKSLYIFLHECGHANLHFAGSKKRPVYVKEYEAEQFAHRVMRAEGVAVPAEMTKRAKSYVRRKIRAAVARGLKTVRSDIRAWAK